MNEIQVQAQINMLVEQRNNAMNAVVNLTGELAVLHAKVNELQGKLDAVDSKDVVIEGASDE